MGGDWLDVGGRLVVGGGVVVGGRVVVNGCLETQVRPIALYSALHAKAQLLLFPKVPALVNTLFGMAVQGCIATQPDTQEYAVI